MKTAATALAALLVILIAFGITGAMDYDEAKRLEEIRRDREEGLSCIRTYIVRPRGDAIRCNECRFVLADGSSITKEGC